MTEKTNTYGVQEYLSLGYIYLILLGMVGDVIFYKFLGINILNYAGISDILMAPINTLLNDFRVLLLVAGALAMGYFLYKKILKSAGNKTQQGIADPTSNVKGNLTVLLVFLTLMFAGLKIGAGSALKERIEKGETKSSHLITFSDNVARRVKIIGQNSGYLFYLPEGEKEILITPISGNIKEIKIL